MTKLMEVLGQDRVAVVVRATRIPDAGALVRSLVAGGIRTIELTFTTPDVDSHLREAVRASPDALVGAGTVLSRRQAEIAVEAGAQFLVTPGLSSEVSAVGHEAGIPVVLGAFTATEVMVAMDLGAAAVKIFPAGTAGARHFRHLHGPFPTVKLIASGGIDESNSADFLKSGAYAVTAGSSVVSASDVEAANWFTITENSRGFLRSLVSSEPPPSFDNRDN